MTNYRGERHTKILLNQNQEDWTITCIDTGLYTATGGRVKMLERYLADETFMVTYGDGIGNVDINKLLEFHKSKQKIVTITGVHATSKYGTLKYDRDFILTDFSEKPRLTDIVNGGFFVFESEIFDHLQEDKMMVETPFKELARSNNMAVYKHTDFWHPLDTYKDYTILNELWLNNPKWKLWGEN